MTMDTMTTASDDTLLAEAARLGIPGADRLAASDLAAAVRNAHDDWRRTNRTAIDQLNGYVDENGLPLEHVRIA